MITLNYTSKNNNEECLTADGMAAAIAESELKSTDYIIIKIQEAVAVGDVEEADRIRKEHAADIARRQELRDEINAIKAKWES